MLKVSIRQLLFVLLAAVASATAQAYEVPPIDQVLQRFGNCPSAYLPTQFRMLVWNVEKGQAGDRWSRDFEFKSSKAEIISVQEAMMNEPMVQTALRTSNVCWDFAISFLQPDQVPTGVMTGSAAVPLRIKALRSPGSEPILRTPKMSLVTEYAVANSPETLWVANIHALNFVSNQTHLEHIQQVVEFLQRHQGPLIFAGDFNTWNRGRLKNVEKILTALGLSKVLLDQDQRLFPLDHIYVRGLKVTEARLHTDINTSDHNPLTAQFQLQ